MNDGHKPDRKSEWPSFKHLDKAPSPYDCYAHPVSRVPDCLLIASHPTATNTLER